MSRLILLTSWSDILNHCYIGHINGHIIFVCASIQNRQSIGVSNDIWQRGKIRLLIRKGTIQNACDRHLLQAKRGLSLPTVKPKYPVPELQSRGGELSFLRSTKWHQKLVEVTTRWRRHGKRSPEPQPAATSKAT